MVSKFLSVLALTTLASTFALAQTKAKIEPKKTVEAQRPVLHEIYATVKDSNGAFVSGLNKSSFSITEDGVSQKIKYLGFKRTKVNFDILIDNFSDPKNLRQLTFDTVKQMIDSLQAKDRVSVTSLGSSPNELSESSDKILEELNASLDVQSANLPIAQNINYYADYLERSNPNENNVIILISQAAIQVGSPSELRGKATKISVSVIHVGAQAQNSAIIKDLETLANATGGKLIEIQDANEAGGALDLLVPEKSKTYHLAYESTNSVIDGKSRVVAIESTKGQVSTEGSLSYVPTADDPITITAGDRNVRNIHSPFHGQAVSIAEGIRVSLNKELDPNDSSSLFGIHRENTDNIIVVFKALTGKNSKLPKGETMTVKSVHSSFASLTLELAASNGNTYGLKFVFPQNKEIKISTLEKATGNAIQFLNPEDKN